MATKVVPFTEARTSNIGFSLHFIARELIIALLLGALLIITLISVTIGWIVIPEIVSYLNHDQTVHLGFAIDMFSTGIPPIAHFLYQSLVINLHLIVQDNGWSLSAVLANLLAQVFTGIIIYLTFRVSFQSYEKAWQPIQRWIVRWICAALAIGVLIAAPIYTLLTAVGGLPFQLLLGFVTPTTYHNPTIIILRPFALSLYLLITTYILPSSKLHLKGSTFIFLIVLMMVVTLLCGLGKPSYLLTVLPAMCLCLVWAIWCEQSVGWRFALIGVLIPLVVMLAWQYIFTFVNLTQQFDANAGIAFDPFKAILRVSGPSVEIMILRFAVSILFPAVVYLIWWKSAKHNRALNFAWLTFFFGAFLMYFLAETGSRATDGNFFWSAYITIFILNIASVRFAFQMWLELHRSGRFGMDWRTVLIIILFSLHVWSGIAYIDWLNQWLYSTL